MQFELRPEGLYRGRIRRWGLEAAKTGNPQWVLKLLITEKAQSDENPDDGFEPVTQPFSVDVFNTITTNTVENVLNKARTLGFDSADPLDLDPKLGKTPFDFSDKQVVVNNEHHEWPEGSGKVREKWQLVIRSRPLTKNQLDSFVSLYGDVFKEYADQGGPTSAAEYYENLAERTAEGV